MSIYKNKNLLALKGKLFKFPTVLINYIADIFSHGLDRNRAIDSVGNHNNALMGGYLLAASNTVIAITGILTTDTIIPLTSGGNVGTVTVNGTMSFTAGSKYGAFEIYRAGTLLGRYCLTERQGLHIINQVTGGLPNGLLGGTTTTVWQRSNAFYCETNHTGYSISDTGWVTSAGASLTVGTIIPADPANPTKCMAWVSSVQQELQYVGKAKNSVSVVPISHYISSGNQVNSVLSAGYTITSHYIHAIFIPINIPTTGNGGSLGGCGVVPLPDNRSRGLKLLGNWVSYIKQNEELCKVNITSLIGEALEVTATYNGATTTAILSVKNIKTGYTIVSTNTSSPTSIIASAVQSICGGGGASFYISKCTEIINGINIMDIVCSQHAAVFYDVFKSTTLSVAGVTTNLLQNIDLVYNTFNQTGYEIWTNGTDYRIYPLASNGTRIITPAGYTLVATVTAGNMPSVADSRMSTFKYALANSYAVRQSVPEAFDTTDQCAPKLLTYSELSALSANPKVIKTEADGKITNIKIKL